MKRSLLWKRIGIGAAVVFALWVIVEVLIAGHDLPAPPIQTNGITLKGGHVNGNRISTKSWNFDYQKAQLSPDGSIGTVQGVKNGIVYKKGKPYLRIAAESISVDTGSLNFSAIGKVHVVVIGDPEGRSFDTDLITWTNASKVLEMDHPSYLHSEGQTLLLNSVSIDFNKDQIHLGSIGGNVVFPKK